tara:strand:- start:177 stop:563 length:387 start_codon:yes stop_codon:yes gene_type:complete
MESLRKRLESHPVIHLRKAISAQNVKGYSSMKKAEIVDLMLKTPERFNDIKMYAAPARMTKEQLEAGAKKALSNTAAGKRMDAKKKAAPKPKVVNKSVNEVKAMLQKAAKKKTVNKSVDEVRAMLQKA